MKWHQKEKDIKQLKNRSEWISMPISGDHVDVIENVGSKYCNECVCVLLGFV